MPGDSTKRYPLELRQRAVRMVAEVRADHDSEWAAMKKVAQLLGVSSGETVRKWVRQAQVDGGDRGQCDLDTWRDVTDIAAGYLHTVGVRSDGRVLAAGARPSPACAVDDWQDVTAVAAGSYHTVGVTASGRVVATGDNGLGQCDVGGWRDVIAVAAGSTHTLGLRADGTVLSSGNNADHQCEVHAWTGIQPAT